MELLLCCPCAFGLESVLSGEIKRLGGQKVTASDGRVDFTGGPEMVAKANLWLRTAERVLLVLGQFEAKSFTELFDQVERLPWEDWIGKNDAFPVKGWSLKSQLHSVPDCQSILKKAVVKRLGAKYGVSWFTETGTTYQIQFSIWKDRVTVMLDTSGQGLHKRGYRRVSNLAPIKETLAAGILDIARIYPDTQLYDPFCGSGTFLVEAALKAKNIAPGLHRRFAAETWPQLPAGLWQKQREDALLQIRQNTSFHAFGSDISAESIAISEHNLKNASVLNLATLGQADVKDFVPPEQKFLVVCNPPYGERMLSVDETKRLYRTMGKAFRPSPNGAYHIISALEDFETLFGRKANKRRKLYNGMLKCYLYSYLPQ